jgi:hypothetical protein
MAATAILSDESCSTLPITRLREISTCPGGFEIRLKYLIDDGFIEFVSSTDLRPGGGRIIGVTPDDVVILTDAGQAFVRRWLNAQDLDEQA